MDGRSVKLSPGRPVGEIATEVHRGNCNRGASLKMQQRCKLNGHLVKLQQVPPSILNHFRVGNIAFVRLILQTDPYHAQNTIRVRPNSAQIVCSSVRPFVRLSVRPNSAEIVCSSVHPSVRPNLQCENSIKNLIRITLGNSLKSRLTLSLLPGEAL